MLCFRCGKQLEEIGFKGRIISVCPQCGASMVSVSALRGLLQDKECVNSLWQASEHNFSRNGISCCLCGNIMHQVRIQIGDGEKFEVDVCRKCMVFWFDRNELERLPIPEEQPVVPKHAPNTSIDMSKPMDLPDDMPAFRGDDTGISDYLLAAIGIPCDRTWGGRRGFPYITATLIVLCTAALCFQGHFGFDFSIERFGFTPANPLRSGGAGLFISSFMHTGLRPFLVSMYFILISGKLAEPELGYRKTLILIICSLALSRVLGCLFSHAPESSCVGADFFAAGFMSYGLFTYPMRKLSFYLTRSRLLGSHWIELPFWYIFLTFVFVEAVMIYADFPGSGAGFSGGIIAGILLALSAKYHSFKAS